VCSSDLLTYEPGDHLGVFPENDTAVVEYAAKILGVDLDAVFSIYPVTGKELSNKVVGPTTVRQALLQWCDLTNPPRKGVLQVLAEYATDEKEKKRLLLLSDDEKPQPYAKWIKDDMRCILEVLEQFRSVKIPFDHFLEIVPRLAPRHYSISSSLKEHPGRVHVTSVVIDFITPAERKHKGVCSNWLARQVPTNGYKPPVALFVQKANFHLPKNISTPVIMIGPGTGLAPFRGFIQERKKLAISEGKPCVNILFFGCRSSKIDYIYREELEQAQKDGFLQLFLAFSRDQPEKIYVQHKLHHFKDGIWSILNNQNGLLYICGDARQMAKDVHQALISIIVEKGNKTSEQAEQYLTELVEQKRYLTDVWF